MLKYHLNALKDHNELQRKRDDLVEQLYGVYPDDSGFDGIYKTYIELICENYGVPEETLSSFMYDFDFGDREGMEVDDIPMNSIEDFCNIKWLD